MIIKDTKNYYAHTKENKPKEEWQLLKTHLINTAELAKGFAKDFGYSNLTEIAKIAGLFALARVRGLKSVISIILHIPANVRTRKSAWIERSAG